MSELDDAANTYCQHGREMHRLTHEVILAEDVFKAGALWLLEEAKKLYAKELTYLENGSEYVLLDDLEEICLNERK